MYLTSQLARRAVVIAVLLAAAGCGGNKVYPVKGKVTFEGRPLKGGGSIAFVPLNKQEGKAAAAQIGEDGTYVLMTHKPGDGSMPGEFRVVITQVTEREPDPTRDGERPGKSINVVAEADRIPHAYSDHYKSPLKATVETKDNEINFDLKRDPGKAAPAAPGAMGGARRRDDLAQLDHAPR